MGVEIHQLEPDCVEQTGYNRAREARDIAAPEKAADHRRQRDDADQDGDAAEAGRGRRSEQLSDRHEPGDQSGPYPTPSPNWKSQGTSPCWFDKPVRLIEPA